jgi:hypothetical protein
MIWQRRWTNRPKIQSCLLDYSDALISLKAQVLLIIPLSVFGVLLSNHQNVFFPYLIFYLQGIHQHKLEQLRFPHP